MRWNLHGRTIEGHTNDDALARAWAQSFASLPPGHAAPEIVCRLDVTTAVPGAPTREPDFRQGDLLRYYVDGTRVTAYFPRYGALYLDLEAGTTSGALVPDAVETYGVLEDMVAISLTPHLRRHDFFLVHAFAAAPSVGAGAALIVGSMGAGKTTTGMALLDAGWKLLSNDSPIVAGDGSIRHYPGVLAAYPDTFARFPTTAVLATQQPARHGRRKLIVTAESIWPDVWLDQAAPGAIFFPQIEERGAHALTPLNPLQTLQRLLPHAVEQWDRPMIPRHLAVLRQLVERAPGYVLHLSPNVREIPAVVEGALRDGSVA